MFHKPIFRGHQEASGFRGLPSEPFRTAGAMDGKCCPHVHGLILLLKCPMAGNIENFKGQTWRSGSMCPWPYTSVEVPDGGQRRELQRTDRAVGSMCPWPYSSVEVPDGGQRRELQRTDMAVWQRVSMALHSTPRFILPALHPSVSTCDSAHATSSTSLIIPHRHCWQRTPVFP